MAAPWVRRTAVLFGAGAAAGAVGVAVAGRRWHTETHRLLTELSGGASESARTVRLQNLAALPAPVQRYFRLVLREGQPYITRAVMTQQGEFRSKESGNPDSDWQPFTATQVFTTSPPGFVWDARITMSPAGTIWVRDGYVRGQASMLGAVLATIPVVRELDAPELREGALLRYLAEAVWIPTALLPESGVRWSEMDHSHARATLTDDSTVVSLEFEFAADGRVLSTFTPDRPRSDPRNKGRYTTAPWGGRYGQYQERDGMQVPTESEVYWIIAGREQPYYRGRNVSAKYEDRQGL
jgi:hypothetical protein